MTEMYGGISEIRNRMVAYMQERHYLCHIEKQYVRIMKNQDEILKKKSKSFGTNSQNENFLTL